jgi:uncharacterized OB-fold protein
VSRRLHSLDVATTQIPVDPGLFTWPADEPELLGSRCTACGVMTFPTQPDCPRCYGSDMETTPFARRGTLWTFTTQEFVPKSPPYARQETEETFRPFAVGYVEFPGQARVEGRIDTADLDSLAIGMEMEVVVVPFMEDDDGNEVVTYAFRPVGEVRRG